MILVDFSNLAYACILENLATTKKTQADISIVRQMLLFSLRSNVKRFKREYGEVVICYDADTYWRTDIFPHYKYKRKKDRENSALNWASIHTCLDALKAEFKANLMYKVLSVERCEADDIIGYLSHVHGPTSKIMIISGDKDFAQLHVHAHVHQYSPTLKKLIRDEFPKITLKQQIIRGDFGDGVPNILSPDDVFVVGGRQKPIMEKKLIGWLNMPIESFCTEGEMLKNFKRNEILIDLRNIPVEVKQRIGYAYETTNPAGRGAFLNYLIMSGLKDLAASVEDF